MKTAIILAVLAAGANLAHAGDWGICANSAQRQEALSVSQVVEGTVLQVRNVAVEPSTTANVVSTSLGRVIGAALGSRVGNGQGRIVAGAIGGLLGAVAGKTAGEHFDAQAQEAVIRLRSGNVIAVTQAESSLYAGQEVLLVSGASGKVRVIPSDRPVGSTERM